MSATDALLDVRQYPRERAFLLGALGVRADADVLGTPSAMRVNWDAVVALAGRAMLPLLAYRVEERGLDAPASIRVMLEECRRANAVALVRRRAELGRILETLGADGESAVVTKGFALAHLVYPSPETRVMSDVDLWIDCPSLRPLVERLGQIGWKLPWRARTLGAPEDGPQLMLALEGASMLLELHRTPLSLAVNVPHRVHAMYHGSIPVSAGGVRFRALAMQDAIVHQSLHLAERHRFVAGLVGLTDLALLAAAGRSDINWPALADQCVADGIAGWVATSLSASSAMFGAPVSATELARFRIEELPQLGSLACEQAWLSVPIGDSLPSVLAEPTIRGSILLIGRRVGEALCPREVVRTSRRDAAMRMLLRIRYIARYVTPRYVKAIRRFLLRKSTRERVHASLERRMVLADGMRRAGATARNGALRQPVIQQMLK